jgi:ribonucleoside-diphosphate reductase alpha chain|tara:strand:+ start:491 stop:2443 length:1953 start_codon:yes stop_codon:yes gene_type:complete
MDKITEDMSELPTLYQSFIHLSRYSRWLDKQKRRETWNETVTRYVEFFKIHLKEICNYKISEDMCNEIKSNIIGLKVMPSMRALMTAGEALKRDNMANYNCSFIHADKIRCFDEMLYVLLNGVGVGFSVERQFVQKLPTIAEEFNNTDTTIVVADSKGGWAKAYKELISLLLAGQIPKWDISHIRPAGSRLRTFGGRSSGSGPLDELFRFTIQTFKESTGRKLTSFEVHKLFCKIADVVVVGGVRRASLISLSNLSDIRMRHAKSGQWWIENPELTLSNNSVAYTEKPDIGIFMEEWLSLYNSKSGERGIFNRNAAINTIKGINTRAKKERRSIDYEVGINPCGEIILRSKQCCNLSEVVVKSTDTVKDLKEKIRIATIIGTFQASLTDFKYVSSKWSENCKEEALLGVSMTGIMDNHLTNGLSGKDKLIKLLNELRDYATEVNKEWSKKIGINQAAAITCVKPSGNVSQLVDSSSGIHARHSKYYIRAVRVSKKDPIAKFMISKGFPCEDDITKPDSTTVFSFPIKAPKGCITRTDKTAIEQLELWMVYKEHYCDHNPSTTINIKENEWLDVGSWVYKNFEKISGVAFLPFSEHCYQQAPYQECEKEEYHKLLKVMPKEINWDGLNEFEITDNTEGSQQFSCMSGSCEI